MNRFALIMAVLGGLSLTGLPTLAATAVWTFLYALQQVQQGGITP